MIVNAKWQRIMVSVIVPIFNREKLLRRCVDSIVAQTYDDIEIILVDDGSTDTSGRICDEYALIDSRIIVIHQKNMGSSLSRIHAIGLAHGEYVLFVDSDDWIEHDMVACLLAKAQADDVDIVWCNFFFHLPEQRIFCTPIEYNPAVMLDAIFSGKNYAFIWNKLYRTELWHNLEPSNIDYVEDMFYTTQILVNNPSMSFVALPLYHHDQTPSDSLTRLDDFFVKCLSNYERCHNHLVSHCCFDFFKASLSNRVLKSKVILLKQGKLKEAQSTASFSNFDIRNYPIPFPVSIIYWIAFNGGIIGRCLFSYYMRLRKGHTISYIESN